MFPILKCYKSSYDGTNWDDSWVQATYLLQNRTVNVLVLWGAEIRNIHNFDETWMIVPLWYKQEAQLSLATRAIL